MNFIKADELCETILSLPNTPDGFSDTYDKEQILSIVDDQPVIEAIPIEWLERQLDAFGEGFYNLRSVIKQWRRENETD